MTHLLNFIRRIGQWAMPETDAAARRVGTFVTILIIILALILLIRTLQ